MIIARCVVCAAVGEVTHSARVCVRHMQRMLSLLHEITQLHETASDAGFLSTTREIPDGWSGSNPPCNLYPLSLTDRRSRYGRPGDPVSATRVLAAWCRVIVPGCTASGDLEAVCRAVGGGLPGFVSRGGDVVRFARHLSCVVGGLRAGVLYW